MISAKKIAYTELSKPPLASVRVKGVTIVMTTAVLTHRKTLILKYNDVCFWLSELCFSKLVNILAIWGKTELQIEMAAAAT